MLEKIYTEKKGVVLNLKYKCKETPKNKKENRGGIIANPIISVSSNRPLEYYSEQKKYCLEAFHWSFVHNYKQPKYYTYPEPEDTNKEEGEDAEGAEEYDGLLHLDERKVVAVVFFLPENYPYLKTNILTLS